MPTSATSLSDDAGGDSSAEIHSNQMQPTGGDLGTAVRMAPPPPPPHPSALRRSSGSAFTGGENAGAAFLGSTTARRNSPKSASTNTDIMRRVGSRRHQSHAGQSSHSAIKSITGGAYTIHLDGDDGGVEMKAAQPLLNRALHMREGYKGVDKGQTEGLERLPPPVALHVDNGTYLFSGETTKMVSWEQFYDDLRELQQCVQNPYCQSASCYRLNVLEEKYNIYKVCNGELEESTDRYRHGGGVFANSCKVDNYVQMNTMMNAQSLVEFIQETIDERGEDVVMLAGDLVRDRVPQTLQQTCEMLEFDDPAMITVDSLGLQPSLEKPNANFDALNPDLNRGGSNSSDFLRLFLTPNTINKGAYLAEMVREALNANEEKTLCVQATETAVEITGLIPEEWEDTAKWIKEKRLDEYRQNRWSITLPRRKMRAAQGSSNVSPLVGGTGNGSGNASSAAAAPGRRMSDNPITFTENSGMRSGTITHDMANANGDMDSTFENHQQHLEALFLPLFLATIAPEDPKNADIANLLLQVGSFVIEFNEEERDVAVSRKTRRPADVPWTENVPDAYFSYYVWTNIASLNALRRRRGLNVFQLRSVAGAARSPQHVEALALSYLLCDHIVNGLALEMQPVMQYLFGLQRIGVSMCPLRCSTLSSVAYPEHPFTTLFRRGLRVSLSTVSPLYLHHSINPLTEEYGVASKVLRLSPVDVSEIALNSVLISSFEDVVKGCWIGDGFVREGWRGNSYEITSVPTSRLELRDHMWRSEMQLISVRSSNAGAEAPSASNTIAVPSIAINPAGGPLMPSSGPTSTFTIADADDGSVGFTNANSTAVSRRETTVSAGVDDTTVNNNNSAATATALHGVQAPWTVIDPRIRCTRLHLVGPYDRDMQHTMVAHNLHRAMELRAQYTRSSNAATAGQRSQKQQAPQRGGVAGTELYRLTQQASQIEHAFKKEKTDAFDEDEWMYKTVEGVVVPHEVHQIPRLPKEMHHYEDFRSHVQELRAIVENYHVRGFCARRLQLLENRFKLHVAVNHSLEAGSTADRASQNRDFYQSTKIDNNVRMETGMTARQLLDFIVSKAHNSGDDIVSHQKGREPQTLRQLLSELNISAETLTVDDLNVQVDTTLNVGAEQYTPEGRDELLTLLLKTDNQMKGRYFAELTKLTFENFKRDRFTFTENRLPVYGASATEWELMSSWYDTHGMSSIHNQWMIQIPRIYGYLRKQNKVQSFAEYIENIFKPLWNVSLHPSKDPRLFHFVNHISGFDCVEDERRPDQPLGADTRPPHEWVSEEDPPYNYYMYHLWANIYSLNEFRRRRNFSTFSFRPSCGETGQMDHLIGGFLLSNGINYGVQLGDEDPLQYLFYLAQVGVTLSPLSNNTKVLSYLDNPFPKLFRRGLMVTLGTDSPLMYHHTQEPLLEEYSIASKIWKLSPNDMCEIARNSVLQSGFGPAFKQERLGELFFLSSSLSNDASRTHLSDVRVGYRFETYHSEIGFLEYISGQTFQKSLLTLPEEEQWQNDFYESVRHRNVPPPINSIIDSNPNEADIEKLTNQRAAMRKELEELSTTMADLQRQNKQLTEKLAEERYRDQQAAQLRRRLVEGKAEDIGELLLDNAGMPNGFTFLRGAPDATDAAADAGIDGAVEAAAVPGVNMDQRSREYWPLVGDGEAKKRIAGDNKHLPNSDSALHGEVPVGGSGTTAPDNTTRQSSSPHTPSLSNKNLPSPSNTTGASRNTPDMADGGNGSTAAAPTPSKRPENPGSLLSHSESLWRRPAAPVKAAATPREEESSSPTAGPTLRSGTAALVPETDSHSDSGVALPRLPVAPRPLPPPPQRRDN